MELHQRRDGVTVLNDAYNANPDSMRAAVDTLAELSRQRTRRTWAVLGDMLELGEVAEQAHAELGALVADRGIDRLVAVGAYAEPMAAAARDGGLTSDAAVRAFPDKAAAQADVLDRVAPGDVVLVKASRGLALDTVAEAILAFWRGLPPLKTIVLAGGFALLCTLLGTRLAIRVLVPRATAS